MLNMVQRGFQLGSGFNQTLEFKYQVFNLFIILRNEIFIILFFSDELAEAWRIFTPILHEFESNDAHQPIKYKFGR